MPTDFVGIAFVKMCSLLKIGWYVKKRALSEPASDLLFYVSGDAVLTLHTDTV